MTNLRVVNNQEREIRKQEMKKQGNMHAGRCTQLKLPNLLFTRIGTRHPQAMQAVLQQEYPLPHIIIKDTLFLG